MENVIPVKIAIYDLCQRIGILLARNSNKLKAIKNPGNNHIKILPKL